MQNPKLITGKLKEWVIITMIVVKTIDAKSPSLKLMAASADLAALFSLVQLQ